MSNYKVRLGEKGEAIATEFLMNSGYQILEKNYRSGHSEIDIVCCKESLLIFVEVRTRNSSVFGYPEQTLSGTKINAILRGAENYIMEKDWKGNVRFDIIAIELFPSVQLMHFKDAFY